MDVITLGTVDLPGDLLWVDELSYTPSGMTMEMSCRGAPLYQFGTKLTGRPITLASPDDERGFFTREQALALQVLAHTPGQVYTLTLPGNRTHQVMFDLERDTPFEFEYKMFLTVPELDQHCTGTLYLIEV